MKKWILAIVLCLVMCLTACFAGFTNSTADFTKSVDLGRSMSYPMSRKLKKYMPCPVGHTVTLYFFATFFKCRRPFRVGMGRWLM